MSPTSASTSPPLPVVIIGGGISGLTLAALFTHNHIPFLLLDSSPPPPLSSDDNNSTRSIPHSYGITLREWAYLPLLRALGEHLPDAEETDQTLSSQDRPISPSASASATPSAVEAFKHAVAVDGPVGGIGRIAGDLVDAATGDVLVRGLASGEEGHVRANRERLREWLLLRIESERIRWGCRVSGVRRILTEADEVVVVELEGGEEVRGALAVAADGVDSTVRSTLPSTSTSAHHDSLPAIVYAWHLTLPRPIYSASLLAQAFTDTTMHFGIHNNTLITPSIVLSTSSIVQLSFAIARPPDLSDARDAGLSPAQLAHKIASGLARLDPGLRPPFDYLLARSRETANSHFPDAADEDAGTNADAAAATADDQISTHPIRALYIPRQALADALRRHGVLFVGDAAHGMPRFAGEGGNHALCDAVELARRLGGRAGLTAREAAGGFYDGAYQRWQEGIAEAGRRFGGLLRPRGWWGEVRARERERGRGS